MAFGTNKTRPLFRRTEPVYESVPGGPIAMLDTAGGTASVAQKEPWTDTALHKPDIHVVITSEFEADGIKCGARRTRSSPY